MSIVVRCECGACFETQEANAGRRAQGPDCGRDQIIARPALPWGGNFLPGKWNRRR
ncbi:MAG: hypothetical protein NVSMB9_37380 [Isosphaeraceae bacterium]